MSADPEAATFPTRPALRALALDRPSVHEWLNGLSMATLALAQAYEDRAEAWAWRCADTMPDSAQGRMDARADALSLERGARAGYDFTSDGRIGSRTVYATLKASMAGLAGQHELFDWQDAHRAPESFRQAAHAAFRACPGLRA